ncbi:hypothetical protein MiYa_01905 [Microcystis aeruginosa NIES-2519]|uniref:Uncharacterized protein n=1 Tax=Microcystis aeruginosa NIES-2519 TaxID=2303981 RepID=A0A5A5R2W5_MICAE|nr:MULTISPECIES: hypothetical protein [Microcystis]GCA70373.1 hypothetical protein MiYa_01905 [Microcystis aeruginosa NIES-2519]GCA83650.1 hypothetical protein MiHa_01615 [Microcystis aeruginosa NIES-2522]GCA87391.1 hypothetical protein MiTa_00717 [Microcystis aeruginosa NIES-4264]
MISKIDNFLTTKDGFHSITDKTDFLIFLILDKEIIELDFDLQAEMRLSANF